MNVPSLTRIPARSGIAALLVLAACLSIIPVADAAVTRKKSIWGPLQFSGASQFPRYADLGVGLYQTSLNWERVARSRPSDPRNPADPAYNWPNEIDYAIQEGQRYGIEVSLMLMFTPSWANGGKDPRWAPKRPGDFADFAAAAARRYPQVRHWMIWGEPCRAENFQPLTREKLGRPLRGAQRTGPRVYARLLDAAYVGLKRVSRRNLVIGGNTWTVCDISPLNWIKGLRLRKGKRPRMDLYGHNPFTGRKPNLRDKPSFPKNGWADFSDLDTLAGWLDRYHRNRGQRRARRLRLFLSEFFIPTDHPNRETNYWVTRSTQAEWVSAGLRITRRWSRIYTMGWFQPFDEPPNGPNGQHRDDMHWGLLDYLGNPKPAYFAFRDG